MFVDDALQTTSLHRIHAFRHEGFAYVGRVKLSTRAAPRGRGSTGSGSSSTTTSGAQPQAQQPPGTTTLGTEQRQQGGGERQSPSDLQLRGSVRVSHEGYMYVRPGERPTLSNSRSVDPFGPAASSSVYGDTSAGLGPLAFSSTSGGGGDGAGDPPGDLPH